MAFTFLLPHPFVLGLLVERAGPPLTGSNFIRVWARGCLDAAQAAKISKECVQWHEN